MVSYKKWYLPVICFVLTLFIFFLIFGLGKRKIQKSMPEPSEIRMPESKGTQGKKLTLKAPKQGNQSAQLKLLNLPWGRDLFNLDSLKTKAFKSRTPVRPKLRTTNDRLLDINLTGIVFFDNHYMALINDTGVREGDIILGFRVLKIKRDHIVLVDGVGDYYTLDLK